jgi:spore germination cell wall hydrolase CwlJ-like protein
LLLKNPARTDARALAGAAFVGTALGIVLGASYLAGGTTRAALNHARVARLAAAASHGYSEAALRSETQAMGPGALAVARRHDPFSDTGADARDLQASQFATRLERRADANGFKAGLMKVNLVASTAASVAPLRMSDANPLAAARELDCLAAAVYYEARGEGSAGQAAVAQVVLNRMRHPSFPHSICGVVFQGAQGHSCQFSFACDGSMRRSKEAAAWRRAKSVAARALGGYVMASVGAATNFHTTGVSPGWSMVRVAQVGSHIFYSFGGRGRAAFKAAPGVYTPAPTAPHKLQGEQPQLILASAMVEQPLKAEKLGVGGPVGAPMEPASAPKPEANAEKPIDKAADKPAA